MLSRLLELITILVAAILTVIALIAVVIFLMRLVMPRTLFVTIAYSHFCETYALFALHGSVARPRAPFAAHAVFDLWLVEQRAMGPHPRWQAIP